MLSGLVVMITALMAGAALGQARERAARVAAPADAGRRVSGTMVSQVENAVNAASERSSSNSGQEGSGVVRASMDSWAGPISEGERRQLPRRLSSEERLLLRQEIQRASEEVYEPYRKQKH